MGPLLAPTAIVRLEWGSDGAILFREVPYSGRGLAARVTGTHLRVTVGNVAYPGGLPQGLAAIRWIATAGIGPPVDHVVSDVAQTIAPANSALWFAPRCAIEARMSLVPNLLVSADLLSDAAGVIGTIPQILQGQQLGLPVGTAAIRINNLDVVPMNIAVDWRVLA
jgi:hypothetical protein